MSEKKLEKDNYQQCYDKLFEEFKAMDFDKAAKASGNAYDRERNKINFKFAGKDYALDCESGEMTPNPSRGALLIITHFMRYPLYDGVPLAGKLISLKEAPGGGSLFYPAFKEMAIDPLAAAFGNDAQRIYRALEPLGGTKASLGHASITINVFPKIPVTIVIWEGDEEIPAAATILYDKSVSDYAHIEDVISVGITAAEKVIRACK